ncbi:hypothetical protein [Qipengyuania sp. 483]
MYLTKNSHGVYYYRRPISLEDQSFWRGSSGTPKKEWNKSLGTKDRREAIARLSDASEMYYTEREAQFLRNGTAAAAEGREETEAEREEREAAEAELAASIERKAARRELRVERRRRMSLTTAQLSPEEAAWHDLVREKEAKIAELLAARDGQRELNEALEAEHKVNAPDSVESLLAAYEADKAPKWATSSAKAVKPVFRALREVFPGRKAGGITRQEARDFVALLERLPTQIGKRKETKHLTVPEAVKAGAKLGLPTLLPKTVNDGYIIHASAVWNWGIVEGLVPSNPFTGLSVHDPVADGERRDPFTPAQLSKLFSSEPWESPWRAGDTKHGAFWVPLLCLFHGLRNGEASGLRVEDVYESDSLPVLHIREYEGRTIKTADARAVLPIHPELLQLGFLRFVEERRATGQVALFPDGKANNRGQHGAKLAERFSAHVKALGFEGRKLGMHSFRHNFEDRLRAAELSERTALSLARRKEAGSSGAYGHGLSTGQKAQALAKISYPQLDLSHLEVAKAGQR